ncbi:MAG: DNA replication and repair protein RecF [Gemmatimonadetes bacterium]|nr:DNA replication and repair protein RecF [Gemmatimonadota bacterium]NNM04979.1 DNA replication and repair protein RecF [Gemmatimonadota bacterium]
MHLSGLQIRHFRNLVDQQLDLPVEGVAIVGENAQGKTNLLEAIYYLETFRSFRGSRDDKLVAFGEEFFRVAGALVGRTPGEGVEVAAAFQVKGKKKKITLDGDEPERLSDGLGRLAAVVFSPMDVTLVSDGPGARRRYLDIVLSLNVPGYLGALQRFRQILSQRNAALRDGRMQGTVGSWDEGLVESGARVVEDRLRWVERWQEEFSAYYRRVSGTLESRLQYQPGVRLEGATDRGPIADAFRLALSESREREARLGNTVVGPQRDDLLLTVTEGDIPRDLREFGSGGQRRTAALALRLVEAATIRKARGQEPIILMDDVFAELDPGRSERILALMEEEETGQVLLTVPKESDIRLRRDSLPRWRIANGVLEW